MRVFTGDLGIGVGRELEEVVWGGATRHSMIALRRKGCLSFPWRKWSTTAVGSDGGHAALVDGERDT
jgi:hypothetical protein